MANNGIKIVKLDTNYELNSNNDTYLHHQNKPKKAKNKPSKSKYINKKKLNCELLLSNTEKIKKLLEKKKKTFKVKHYYNKNQDTKDNNVHETPKEQNNIDNSNEPINNTPSLFYPDTNKQEAFNYSTDKLNPSKNQNHHNYDNNNYDNNNYDNNNNIRHSKDKNEDAKNRRKRLSNKRTRSHKKLKSKRKVRKYAPQTIDKFFREIVNDSGTDISKLKPTSKYKGRMTPKNKKTKKRIEMENIINILKQVLAKNDYEVIYKFVGKIKRHHTINLLVLFKICKLNTNAPTPLLKNILKIYLGGGFNINRY